MGTQIEIKNLARLIFLLKKKKTKLETVYAYTKICFSGTFDWSRNATTVVCHLYEGHSIYLPTLPDYHNRVMRLNALQDITNEFNRRYFTTLNIDDVKKNIRYPGCVKA